MRTPACQVFFQENSGLDWRNYKNASSLRRAVPPHLIVVMSTTGR
jgi:hypothetical protein